MIRELAFWTGSLLVIAWSCRDFGRGLPEGEIRYATQRDRYLLGTLVYAFTAFVAYLITVAAWVTLSAIASDWDSLPWWQPIRATPSSLLGALVVIVILPNVQPMKYWADRLRMFTWALALFPGAVMRLSGYLMWNAREHAGPAGKAFEQELGRYGVPAAKLRRQLSPSVYDSVLEAQFVRDGLKTLMAETIATGRMRDFLTARAAGLETMERNYQAMVRRAAQVCVLADRLIEDDDEPRPLSDLVAYRAARLLGRCRKLIAEAALSCFDQRQQRRTFIGKFGYEGPTDWLLPYWPLLAIFVGDASLFLVPIVLHAVPVLPDTTLFALFLLGHAIAQVFAVAWAILPKAESNFSRPSLDWFPWRSYLIFGCASYVTGAALMALINYAVATALKAEQQPLNVFNGISPYLLSCIFSAYFPVMTVCLSFLTDLHLHYRSSARWGTRVRDAVVTGAALAGTNLLIRLVMWDFGVNLPWAFFFIVAALGGFVGALVPGSAAPYLITPLQGTLVGSPSGRMVRLDDEGETVGAPADRAPVS